MSVENQRSSQKMTVHSLLGFILLTNLWDDGYIGICATKDCKAQPKLRTDEPEVENFVGNNVTLVAHLETCGHISWYRGNLSTEVLHGDGRKWQITRHTNTSLLTINNLTQADAGSYLCRLVNTGGSEKVLIFQLEVKAPIKIISSERRPILTLNDKDQTIIHGNILSWTCTVKPEWDITLWRFDFVYKHKQIHVDSYTDHGTDISINQHTATCIAWSRDNIQTLTSKEVMFSVIPATPKLISSVTEHVITAPANFTLTCLLSEEYSDNHQYISFYRNNQVKATYNWTSNWHTEGSRYSLISLQPSPKAEYTCTVTIKNLESLHSSGYHLTIRSTVKTPTLTSSVNDSVIKVNSSLELSCYTESEEDAANSDKTTHYIFFKDAKLLPDGNQTTYQVDTRLPQPMTIFSCTAVIEGMNSLPSNPRKLIIVGKLKKPVLIKRTETFPHIADGSKLAMECKVGDFRATHFRFFYGTLIYNSSSHISDWMKTILGNKTAWCQYFIGEVSSPNSTAQVVTVSPSKPTLTPSIDDYLVSINRLLTVRCDTKSFHTNLTKSYHFYKGSTVVKDSSDNKYTIPTNTTTPKTSYTCTVTMAEIVSAKSNKYNVSIVPYKTPSLFVHNKNFLHGGSLKMACLAKDEIVVGYMFYYKDGPPVTQSSHLLTVDKADIGTYKAKCRYNITEYIVSPASDIVEIKVLPHTPTISASITDEGIPVKSRLTLTCTSPSVVDRNSTESVPSRNSANYSFYSNNKLTSNSPSSNNTYQVPTNSSTKNLVFTCTVTINSTESRHSSEHRIYVYDCEKDPYDDDCYHYAVLFVIVCTVGAVMFTCMVGFVVITYVKKRMRKRTVRFFSVGEILHEAELDDGSDAGDSFFKTLRNFGGQDKDSEITSQSSWRNEDNKESNFDDTTSVVSQADSQFSWGGLFKIQTSKTAPTQDSLRSIRSTREDNKTGIVGSFLDIIDKLSSNILPEESHHDDVISLGSLVSSDKSDKDKETVIVEKVIENPSDVPKVPESRWQRCLRMCRCCRKSETVDNATDVKTVPESSRQNSDKSSDKSSDSIPQKKVTFQVPGNIVRKSIVYVRRFTGWGSQISKQSKETEKTSENSTSKTDFMTSGTSVDQPDFESFSSQYSSLRHSGDSVQTWV